jgi:hypothetical protein
MNTQQMVTKVNKSAEILFNQTSAVAVGLQISELLGVKNNHFLEVMSKLTNRKESKDDAGTIGAEEKPLTSELMSQHLLGTYLIQPLGRESKQDPKEQKICVNFYANRLTTEHKKTYGFCLVFQPIIIIK